jgi:hypothetical protein
MHPNEIRYQNSAYGLGHLTQSIREFEWTPKGSVKTKFNVKVRYSNHCYSKSVDTPVVDDVVIDQKPLRVFCPYRHDYTYDLATMIDGVFQKPTTTVQLTQEDNWHIYRIYAKVKLYTQDRYCVFFRIKKDHDRLIDGATSLDMHVESAYPRTKIVPTVMRVPFGAAAAMAALGESYFKKKGGAAWPPPKQSSTNVKPCGPQR